MLPNRAFWFSTLLLILSLLQGTKTTAAELNADMSLSELEYEIADNPRVVNDWARKVFAGMDRSKVPNLWVKMLATVLLSAAQMGEDRALSVAQYKKEIDEALTLSRQIRSWQEYDLFQSITNQTRLRNDFDAYIVEELKLLSFIFKNASIDVALIRLSQIANSMQGQGRRAAARKYANQAKLILKENKQVSDFRRQSIHVSIAMILMEDEDTQKSSEELFEDATRQFKKMGRRHVLAQTTYNFAASEVFRGRNNSTPQELQKAIGYLELAIAAAHDIGDASIAGLSRALLAHALNRLHKFVEAEKTATEALESLQDSHDIGTISASIAAGTAQIELKKYELAKINLTRAEDFVEEVPSTPLYLRVELKKMLSQLSFANKSFDKAFRYQVEYYYLDSEWNRQNKKSTAQARDAGFQTDDERLSGTDKAETFRSYGLGFFLASILLAVGSLTLVFRKNRKIRQLEIDFETQTLKRSFPPKLVEEVMLGRSNLDESAQTRLVTVLFADLVDFGPIVDKLGSDRVVRLLNSYFSKMSAIIFDHEGMLDRFTGNGVMVVFGIPHRMAAKEQAIRSLHCGIEMMQMLKDLNVEWKKEFGFSIQMRMGLCQGEAVVGSFGTAARREFTAIGSTVRMAQAVQNLAQPEQILLSESMARFFPDDCEQAGEWRSKSVFSYPWQLEKADEAPASDQAIEPAI